MAGQLGGSSTGQARMAVSQTGGGLRWGMQLQNQLQWFDLSGNTLARRCKPEVANYSLSPHETTLVMSAG